MREHHPSEQHIQFEGNSGRERVARLRRRRSPHRLACGSGRAGCARLPDFRPASDARGPAPRRMDCGSRSLLSREQCSGHLRCRRCSPSVGKRRHLRRGRRGYGGETRARISWPPVAMNQSDLQQVRSTPLFSSLTDLQLGCIEPGAVIDTPAGTVLVSEGDRSPYFFVVLEGEIRLTRNYDRQSVLMGAIKPGNYTGEVTLLLDIPWLATARVGKTARIFRLGQ